jgi:hypothetical protein
MVFHLSDYGSKNEYFVLHVQFGCALLLLCVGGVLLFSLMTQQISYLLSWLALCSC